MKTALFGACLTDILGRRNPFCVHELRDEAGNETFRFEVKADVFSHPDDMDCDPEGEFPEWQAIKFSCWEDGINRSEEVFALWHRSMGSPTCIVPPVDHNGTWYISTDEISNWMVAA